MADTSTSSLPMSMQFTLSQDYMAQARSGKGAASRTFKQGEVIIATKYVPQTGPNIKVAPSALVDDMYIIPLSMLSNPKASAPLLSDANNLLLKAKTLASSYEDFKKGSIIGLCIGGAYALITGRTFLVYALIGTVGGGVLAHVIGKNTPANPQIGAATTTTTTTNTTTK